MRNCLLWIVVLLAISNGLAGLAQKPSSKRGVRAVAGSSPVSQRPGSYYALIIGNQNYRNLNKLQTPIHDANEVARLLRERYHFETKVLVDADRTQILTALSDYRRTLPEDSSLLIYYAGHGYHDPDADKAYWLPIDAQRDNNANWISADDITSDVKAIRSSHVLIISDSCYSGYIVGSRAGNVGINPAEMHAFLAKMMASKSRTLMSSGGDEPVADNGASGHSVFAAAILDGFRRINQESFTAASLFEQYIQPAVGGRSAQLPQYSAIRNSGHEYGDFVFSRQTAQASTGKDQGQVNMGSLQRGDTMTPGQQNMGSLRRGGAMTLSGDQAKAMVVKHDFFHAGWNPGGGTGGHQYERSVTGDFVTVVDQTNGLMWEWGGSGKTEGQQEASAYVAALNARKAGGFHDWRLPNLEEAMSLMTSPEQSQTGEAADAAQKLVLHIDKSFNAKAAYFVWTSDLAPGSRVWIVYFSDGICTPESLQYNAYVRAVRSIH